MSDEILKLIINIYSQFSSKNISSYMKSPHGIIVRTPPLQRGGGGGGLTSSDLAKRVGMKYFF